jgi:hypothetical protein
VMFRAGVGVHPARGRDRAFFSESGGSLSLASHVTRGDNKNAVLATVRIVPSGSPSKNRTVRPGKLYDFGIKCRGSLVNPASYDTAPSSRIGVAGRDGARVPQAPRKSADGRVVITVLAQEFAIANASSAAKPK